MKITLLRHAPVEIRDRWICGCRLEHLLREYDAAPVRLGEAPQGLPSAVTVYSSPARRAMDTAGWLFPNHPIELLDEAKEAAFPPKLPFPYIGPAGLAFLLARCAWLCGYAPNVDDVRAVRDRAEILARKLSEFDRTRGDVVLVTHGYFMCFLDRALRKDGWVRSGKFAAGHLKPVCYICP
ncbi:MAG: phosphoglycerate mutase family protein [Opitutaceae bacterium]|nr:phosphoglycerate mutase family protein [Opitutaceae bacterium]